MATRARETEKTSHQDSTPHRVATTTHHSGRNAMLRICRRAKNHSRATKAIDNSQPLDELYVKIITLKNIIFSNNCRLSQIKASKAIARITEIA